jgi:aspartyl-tRNA(Asn)/glutamyl-tRNA(Gln) amidotransferase subunit C
MKLTHEEVRHIAKLAKLRLSEEEVEKFSSQLSDILSYTEMLGEVDTDGIEPIAQITGLQNISFADQPASENLADKLLKQSPMPVEQHMIKVKSIFND